MPVNGSGVMERLAGTTAVPGTTVASAPFNAVIDDVVSGMNARKVVAQGGTGANAANLAAQNLNVVYGPDFAGTGAVAGDPDAIVLTSTRGGYTVLSNSIRIAWISIHDAVNDGTTIKLDDLSERPLKVRQGGMERDIQIGDFYDDQFVEARYVSTADGGTGAFILLTNSSRNSVAILYTEFAFDDTTVMAEDSWDTWAITSEADPDGIVTLAANQFTPNRACRLDWLAVGYLGANSTIANANFKTKLRNITDGTDVAFGSAVNTGNNSTVIGPSIGTAFLEATKAYEIQRYAVCTANAGAFLHNGALFPTGAGNDISLRVVLQSL